MTDSVAQKSPDLSIDLAPDHPRGLKLDNPVMIASELWDTTATGGD